MGVNFPKFLFGDDKVYRQTILHEGGYSGPSSFEVLSELEEVKLDRSRLSEGAWWLYERDWVVPTYLMGGDPFVAGSAWVSTKHTKKEVDAQVERFIRKLALDDHKSPFFKPQVHFRMKMPLFTKMQYEKHQVGASINSESFRYTNDREREFYLPMCMRYAPERRMQGSGGYVEDEELNNKGFEVIKRVNRVALEGYQELLDLGFAPELARIPLSENVVTEFVQTGSLYFYANMCKLRLDKHAQEEIRYYAEIVSEWMRLFFPISWSALLDPPKLNPTQRDRLGKLVYEHFRNGVEAIFPWQEAAESVREQHRQIGEQLFVMGMMRDF